MATMIASHTGTKAAAGGGFLIEDLTAGEIFTPEDFSEEQRQIAEMTAQFAEQEVAPAADEIEKKNFKITIELLRKAGELGLMGVDVPEEYGGLELDKTTSALIADYIGRSGSFSVAFSAHTGIGTLPLVWYGTAAQKAKYLPKLATGEWIGAYALSESSSGSDAMNAKTRAVLNAEGTHYVLNGEKMWISNAGFADLFTVFAKIDGEKFSAFLIERNTPGFAVGAEEHKLGIRGSSTCPLILTDCLVPVENLLGESGKGHHIAFNILNIGRFKLGAACVGGARTALQNGIGYAKERKAFGKSISEFGLIQEKIADCAVGIFASQSMAYRTVGMIDAALADVDKHAPTATKDIQKRIEEYAVECSILKVAGSEMLDMVVDHVVQIYAGYGYVEEYPAERAYRDARINRIFEGTNEINRMIITGWLMKRALSGKLALLPAIQQLMEEVLAGPLAKQEHEGELANETGMLANAKKLALFAAGSASQKHGAALGEQQEVMAAIADMIIEVFAIESVILRTQKMLAGKAGRQAELAVKLSQVYTLKGFEAIEQCARKVVAAVAEGDMLRTQLAIVKRLAKYELVDTIALKRSIALELIETGRYAL